MENEFLTAEVLTYGASLRRLVFGGVDVVLGYDTLPEYERNDGCFGATVGRVCNRIGGASFRADYGVIFLALSITILPMFVMYFLLSRYIVEGVSLGSVKG
ncbi:MAG: hypothetical protein EGQ56_03510 [Clostridiales bacterium]|nr:hypothetical protein [Clostridiales bacterium]